MAGKMDETVFECGSYYLDKSMVECVENSGIW